MGSLALALRAVWWRRGVSLVVLAIAAFVTAAAAAGPVYLGAAGESILQDTLRTAPVYSTGIEVRHQSPSAPGLLGRLSETVRTARAEAPSFGPQVGALELESTIQGPDGSTVASTRLAYREGFCDHIVVRAGSCPTGLGQGAFSTAAARLRGWKVGDEVVLTALQRPVRVTGLYEPRDPADSYWFGRTYFVSRAGADANVDADTIDAVFTPEATFAGLPPETQVRAVVSVLLDVRPIRLADVARVRAESTRFREAISRAVPGAGVDGSFGANADAAAERADALRVPVLLVVVQLLVLSWFVLFMVVASSAEARGGEVALAKARGLTPGSTVAFGLLETLVLLVLAIPAGLALGTFGVAALARVQLLPGTPVELVPLAFAAAAVAALGGLVAAGLAAARTLRTPVLELWRRAGTGRQGGRRNLAADAVVLTLSAAGLAQLALGGRLDGGEPDVVALLAPGLLSLGVALLGARLLPVACRALFRPTRASKRIGLFLGLRQVARRPTGLRVVVILTIAFALATFSVVSWSVQHDNRVDRALAETGAHRVLRVEPAPGTELRDVVRRLDPSGTQAMAVVIPDAGASTKRLVGVDSDRFAAVAFWRDDFAGTPVAELAAGLKPAAPPPVVVEGDGLGVRVSVNRLTAPGPVGLAAELVVSGNRRVTVELGRLAPGTRDYRAAATGCPCRVSRLVLTRPLSSFPMSGALLFAAVEQRRSGAWSEIASFRTGDTWRSLNVGDYAPADSLLAGDAGLRFDFSAPATSTVGIAPVDVPTPLPAIATRDVVASASGSQAITLTGLGRDDVLVGVTSTVEVVPRGGRSAALVDLEYLGRTAAGSYFGSVQEVWLSESAPADFDRRLRDEGVTVADDRRASTRQELLGRQAPSLAAMLFLVGAGIAALLAAGGTVLNVYLLGRRRSYELAAMQAVGVKRRSLLTGVLVEQVLLLGTGTLLGVATGLVGARIALPSVPLYTDTSTFPPPVFAPDPRVVTALVAGIAALMGIAILVAALLLVRAAVPTRLREAQA